MSDVALTMILRPFVAFVVLFVLAVCVRWPLQKFMKDGKLKRFLLYKINQ